jgi:peptidoglycan/LPS O-acetylase OafA/YrhL
MPNLGSELAWLQPKPLSNSDSAILDAVRAVAAWAVMWSHLRTIFFADFQNLPHPSLLLKAIYFVTGFGHQAVMVFFVLSGYLISSSIFRSLADRNWSSMDYAINRAARLYVVLIPGLLLGLLWDFLGSHWLGASGLYTHQLGNLGSGIARDNLTLPNFFGNILFLQTIFCPTFGSNGPLWSLSNEFWYYVLFPVLLFAALAWMRGLWKRALLLSAMVLLLALFLQSAKLVGFLVWMSGSALVLVHSRFFVRRKVVALFAFAATAVLLCACLAWTRTGRTEARSLDLILGIAFALFLFCSLQLRIGTQSSWAGHVSHLCAGFSYSLYVLHFPFLLCLRAVIAPWHRWEPDMPHLLLGLLLGMMTLTYAWLVSLVSEDKTKFARGWIRTALQNAMKYAA